MLQTDDRVLLREAIRPPEGYELDQAIITTYTLDLLSLLTVPLYFTLFEAEDENGDATRDPLALLQALRRHAARISVFCQAGSIATPAKQQQLFGYLESSTIEVASPRPRGVFHPKVWALRYTAPDLPVHYRLGVFSRNLTADKSWDTAVVLDGKLRDRKVGYGPNRPLGEFIAALPDLAVRPVTDEVRSRSVLISEELRKVEFERPEGFDGIEFWPSGHNGRKNSPFGKRADRILVVSPFVSSTALRTLTDEAPDVSLVARPDELDAIDDDTLALFKAVSVVADPVAAEQAADTAVSEQEQLSGLHAKLYVINHGWNASILTGSLNATNAGLDCNVEFMVELLGKRSVCGIDAVLTGAKDQSSLGALLQPYQRPTGAIPTDTALRELEARVDAASRDIALVPFSLHATPVSGGYGLEVRRGTTDGAAVPEGIGLACWPITLPEALVVPLMLAEPVCAHFPTVSAEALTTFLAVSVTGTLGNETVIRRFVLNLPLEGGPSDRRERILRSILRDRQRVLRFLLLLLGDLDAILAGEVPLPGESAANPNSTARGVGEAVTLLEPLVRALHRDPARIDQIAKLLEELRSGEGDELMPEEFDEVWGAVWAVRQEALSS